MSENNENLEYLNNVHSSLFANNHQPIILVDPETGKILESNLAAQLFYGLTKVELKNSTIFDVSANNKVALEHFLKQAASGKLNSWRSLQYNFAPEVYDVKLIANVLKHQGKDLLFITISDPKRANRYMSETELLYEKQYKSFIDDEMCMFIFDFSGKLIHRFSEKNLKQINHLDDVLKLFNNKDQKTFIKKKEKLENFTTLVRYDDVVLNCKINFRKENESVKIYVIFINISQKLKILDDLREKQLFIERVTEQSPNIIYVFDIFLQKNIYINQDLRKYLGYNEDELPADSIEIVNKLIHPDDLKQFIDYELKTDNWTKEYVQKFRMRLKHKNGKWIWFAGYEKEFLRRKGKIVSIVGVLVDITEIIETQHKLLEHEKKLKEAQRIAHLGYWEYDVKKNEVYWSEETYRILGLKPDVKPRSPEFFYDFISPEDFELLKKNFRTFMKTGKPEELVHRILLKDGTIKYVQEKWNAIHDENGNLAIIKGIILDITDRVQLEQKLKAQNKEYLSLYEEYKSQNEELRRAKTAAEESNRLKTEFLHNLSHEIRTPMNGIVGFAQMLESPDISKEDLSFYAQMIINSSKQLLNIIDDILEISKLETKQIKVHEVETDISDFLQNLYSIYSLKAKENGLQLFLYNDIPEEESIIMIDSAKLHKILSNLLENSFKYTNKGFVEIRSFFEDDKLVIIVKDTGIGISPENKEKIFERFRRSEDNLTSQSDGLGLGLAIVKENVELMGGEIHLKSEVGKGAEFKVILPYKKFDGKNKKIEDKDKKTAKFVERLKILIAEDEQINFVYLDLVLKKYKSPIEIIHAKDGAEAVKLAVSEKPDIIFMDLKMPIKNGFEATKEIRIAGINCPIIALTAYSSEDDIIAAQNAGCTDFISKPYDKKIIYKILDEILENKLK